MKFKSTLFISLVFAFSFSLYSQDKSVDVELKASSDYLKEVKKIGDEGFIIMTGSDFMMSKNQNWVVRSYAKDLTLNYEVEIKKTQANKGFHNHFLTTPGGKYTFLFEGKGITVVADPTSATLFVIDDKGQVSEKEITGTSNFQNIQFVFASESYLGFIGYKKDGLSTDETKSKLYYTSMQIPRFTKKTIPLDLPDIDNHDFSSPFVYSGHDNTGFYISRKEFEESGELTYYIYKFDYQGKELKNFEISVEHPHYLRGSRNFQNKAFADIAYDPDVQIETNSQGSAYKILSNNSNSALYFDEINQEFYIYGLLGETSSLSPELSKGSKFWFMNKYDINGNLLWKTDNEINDKFLKTFGMDRDVLTVHNITDFSVLDDGSIKFHLINSSNGKDGVYTYLIDKNSNITSEFMNTFYIKPPDDKFYQNDFIAHIEFPEETEAFSLFDYLKNIEIDDRTFYRALNFTDADILIEENKKSLKLMYFKKE